MQTITLQSALIDLDGPILLYGLCNQIAASAAVKTRGAAYVGLLLFFYNNNNNNYACS